MKQHHIICVDDQEIILLSLRQELRELDSLAEARIDTANSGAKALALVDSILAEGDEIPLIISDQRMPEMNGDEFLIRVHARAPDTRKILLTGYSDIEAVTRLVNHGSLYRYLSKPWNIHDLLLTIAEGYKSYRSMRQIEELTVQNEKLIGAMVSALESANFYFDDDTGRHIRRISRISTIIAEGLGYDEGFVRKLGLYASLHDIGKIGVPIGILGKPGSLTEAEFEQVKQHVVIGANILGNDEIDTMAKNITLYHHERWDGRGYVHGLKGEDIPVESRIVSIADVFDALVNARVYKPAFPLEKALSIVREGAGAQFEPRLVEAFMDSISRIDE